MLSDCSLITLNWLLLDALLSRLGLRFPWMRTWELSGHRSVLLGVALLHAALITLVGHSEGLYVREADLRMQTKSLAKAVLLATAVMCCVYQLHGAGWSAGILVCGAGMLHFGSLWVWRSRASGRDSGSGQADTQNVLIVGAGPVGRRMAAHIQQHPGAGRTFCGFLDDEQQPGRGVIGRVSDLALMARKGFVDEVILAAPHDGEVVLRVIREAKRLRLDLEVAPELFGCDPVQEEVEQVAGMPVICVHAEHLPAAGLVVKRIMDMVGAGLGLIVLSPLLSAIAVLIKLDSSGSVLYVAKRAGRKGRTFRCFKFRTMASDAEKRRDSLRDHNEREGPTFKIRDDPRVTRIGRYLRRYSLDELPQLWNVLKGEMSLVGPRPHPVDEFAAYELGHLARLDVTPGLTGLWQVSARRDPSFDRAMELDREYIRSWNLGLDIRILLRTVLAVASGSGN